MTQPTSTTVISAYQATSVVDTPMRKVEVLVDNSGRVVLRATEFENWKAHVYLIHMEHHEAESLARAILSLDGDVEEDRPLRSPHAILEVRLRKLVDDVVEECKQAVDIAVGKEQ